MEKYFNKVLIIDGSYLLHRQLHQPRVSDLENGGVFGFLRSISKEIHNSKGFFPIVAFDHGLSKRRVEIDPYYKKANERNTEEHIITEENVDDEYIAKYRKQRSKLNEMLPYVGIPVVMFEGWEGDDLIYLLSNICNQCIISTDDKDMLQLITDTCSIRRPMADEFWTPKKLTENGFGDVFDFVIYKSIIGDKSDNIPSSCKGVGEKYAKSLARLIRGFSKDRNINEWYNTARFPRDAEKLKVICEKIDVDFRKSYINFDFDRFIKNVGLIDLILVNNYDTIIRSMIGTITNCINTIDYMKMAKELSNMEINDFSIDMLISDVFARYRNLHNK